MRRPRIRLIIGAVAIVAAALTTACHRLDTNRIPPAPVQIIFNTVADWNTYGLPGAASYRNFILTSTEKVPSNFPYTAMSYTGYGGILLVDDVNGNILAYDLSCPVECSPTIRIAVNGDDLTAECPKCHSVYDIMSLYGHPRSGPAAERGYGLRRYQASPGLNGRYLVVHN